MFFLKKEPNFVTFFVVFKAQIQIQQGFIVPSLTRNLFYLFSFSGKQICLGNTKKRCIQTETNPKLKLKYILIFILMGQRILVWMTI